MSHACSDDPYEAAGVNQYLHWYVPEWGLFKVIFSLRNVKFHLRASPAVLSICDPAKIFLTFKFSYLLFGNPRDKIETLTGLSGPGIDVK
jgi:hypothetical protein